MIKVVKIINIGDVVRVVKQVGPCMTVNKVSTDKSNYFECVWFDDTCNLHVGEFSFHALEKVS